MLSKINFYDKYDKVMEIASNHHEYLDGSGYPRGLKDDQLDILTRILTVCDIFDSLTADDRPYKKKMNLEQALRVLKEMANEGKLDDGIVVIVANYMHEHFDSLFAEMKEEERIEREEQEKVFGDYHADAPAVENQKEESPIQSGTENIQNGQNKSDETVNSNSRNEFAQAAQAVGQPVMTAVEQQGPEVVNDERKQETAPSFGFRPNVNVELITPIRAEGLYPQKPQAPQEANRFVQSFRGIEGILQTVGMKHSAGDFPQ